VPEPIYLTTAELAERERTPESSVRHWRTTGYGPPSVRRGRRVLYRLADVEVWEREQDQAQAGGQAAS